MSSATILFGLSPMIGLALGRFNWPAIAAWSVALAFFAAAVLHRYGFGALSGIGIIAVCLTINQAAYLAGVWLYSGRLVQKHARH
jgi:hypothetical protein